MTDSDTKTFEPPTVVHLLHPNRRRATFDLLRVENSDRVVTPDRRARSTQHDHAAFATLERGQLRVDHLIGRLLRRLSLFHQSAYLARQREPDEVLTDAGAGDRARMIIRIGTRADDGRVAHAPWKLALHAPGGGSRREMALRISRNRTHSAKAVSKDVWTGE